MPNVVELHDSIPHQRMKHAKFDVR